MDQTKLDHLEPDLAEQNQGLHHQIIMQDMHSSGILRSVESSFIINAFVQPISFIYTGIQKSKREKRAPLKLTDTIFSFGTLSIVWFFKYARHFGSWLWRKMKALTVKMGTMTLIGKDRQNVICFVYEVREINCKILLISRCFIFRGVKIWINTFFFPWQLCFFGVALD